VSEPAEIPLFPLHTVLFPDGPLALRIFEPRYLDMISERMKADAPFGVVLIAHGAEAGPAAVPRPVGTLARIVDWNRQDDGLLGITARGGRRFRIVHSQVRPSRLLAAAVQVDEEPPPQAVPARFRKLADLLERLIPHAGPLYENQALRLDDAHWVAFRLAELVGTPLEERQALLESDDPIARLERVQGIIDALATSSRGD
jgi:Lon protease-like protein